MPKCWSSAPVPAAIPLLLGRGSRQEGLCVDRGPTLGGVCLNVGCIPSKALLHAAKVIDETRDMTDHGIAFTAPSIDIAKLRGWKDGIIKKLTGGLAGLAKQRKVTVWTGTGTFASPTSVLVKTAKGNKAISFDRAIIACGSEPATLPFIPHDDPRVIDSTGALELNGLPHRLLVLGGGIIGLEMATVYHALGAKVTIVELMDQIIPGVDKDIVTPLMKRIEKRYEKILLKTKVTAVAARADGSSRHVRRAERHLERYLRSLARCGRPSAQWKDGWRRGRGRRG